MRDARQRAEARFKKAQAAARENERARSDYEAKVKATREKTARLKAQRLEKEAAEKEGKSKKAPSSRGKKRTG